MNNDAISDDLPRKHRAQHEREMWGENYLAQQAVRFQLKFRWPKELHQPRVDLQIAQIMLHQSKMWLNSRRKIHSVSNFDLAYSNYIADRTEGENIVMREV